jgi:hypothetical protein
MPKEDGIAYIRFPVSRDELDVSYIYPVVEPAAITEIVASQPDDGFITLVVAAAISLVLFVPK